VNRDKPTKRWFNPRTYPTSLNGEGGIYDFFRCAEISTEGIADNRNPIVHTAAAFNPTAPEAARQETA
jgi:hypothetical protein